MKICFILGSYPKDWMGGAELQSYFIARKLSKRGHQVYYLAINTVVDKRFYEIDEGINVYRIKKSKNIFQYYSKVYKVFCEIKPDICYSRSRGELPIAFILCRVTRTPLMYAVASDDICYPKPFPYKLWRPRVFLHQCNYWISQVLMKKVDAVISQSDHQFKLLKRNFYVQSLIIKKWIPIPEMSELSEKKDPPVVLWLANIKQIKRPELFIKLAKKCANLKAEFIMAGHISNNNYYRKILRQTKIFSNLRYIGGVSYKQANDLMNIASVFVSTSKFEAFPSTTFIQAWMYRVPTLSLSDDPDDILVRENIGICSGFFDQMISDIKFLIENKEMRKKMGNKARQYVIKEHDIKKIICTYEHIFLELIRG